MDCANSGSSRTTTSAVMHGSCRRVRAAAIRKAKTPAQGGDEAAYLNAFLDARIKEMKREEAHNDVSRVETGSKRLFLQEGNLTLQPPLQFKTYGDSYTITAPHLLTHTITTTQPGVHYLWPAIQKNCHAERYSVKHLAPTAQPRFFSEYRSEQ